MNPEELRRLPYVDFMMYRATIRGIMVGKPELFMMA
jgi:hypothetical protein